MRTNQDSALEYILRVEGGFVNLPQDNGGATNFGISQKTLSEFLMRKADVAEVKYMSKEIAKEIYREWYWNKMMLSEVEHAGARLCIFDQGVNRGIKSVIKQCQFICNEYFPEHLVADGIMGRKTLNCINTINGEAFCIDFLAKSAQFYLDLVEKNPDQKIFLNGWLNRVKNLNDHIFPEDPYCS